VIIKLFLDLEADDSDFAAGLRQQFRALRSDTKQFVHEKVTYTVEDPTALPLALWVEPGSSIVSVVTPLKISSQYTKLVIKLELTDYIGIGKVADGLRPGNYRLKDAIALVVLHPELGRYFIVLTATRLRTALTLHKDIISGKAQLDEADR
jgi:hypothetical protein